MYEELASLVSKFAENIAYYKNTTNSYNEHSTRIEYIDPFLKLLGWDVANEQGLPPQYREVIAENYSGESDRPDYSMTLRGVTKFFVEAKKPSVDIKDNVSPALQARKYGWNAQHKIAVLTNFEYLIIFDTTYKPSEFDNSTVARYKIFHYTEYLSKFEEIYSLISKKTVYSSNFDALFSNSEMLSDHVTQQVDEAFLSQINDWRVALSNELFAKGGRYSSIEVLNDVVQAFINQIVFLRICEDNNLPLYHNLQETVSDKNILHQELEHLFREADKRYNSGLFSGEYIIFDLDSAVIQDMVEALYYPKSPYLFNLIAQNLLGEIYEAFLTEQLVINSSGTIELAAKKDCVNRSVVTTPIEIVKYMTEQTLARLCENKTPDEILQLRIADIACGSGIFLEEAFSYLEEYCIAWYLNHDKEHLLRLGNGSYKLPLEEKKAILTNCIYGIDIDIHAVEVAKFSLLIKLIENETAPSIVESNPVLPNIDKNICFGNSLIENSYVANKRITNSELIEITPFDWNNINGGEKFDAIIGNPPYVNTEDMHALLPVNEFTIYQERYKSTYRQFDKYFVFIERALSKVKDDGYVCYIVPNKFFKIKSGEKLRELIAAGKKLVFLDDFGDVQLFALRTIYSCIVLFKNCENDEFTYKSVCSPSDLWTGQSIESIKLSNSMLNSLPWRLTTDIEFLNVIKGMEKISAPITEYVDIFNGIQTSAERPTPVYWFSLDEVVSETQDKVLIHRNGHVYEIEKEILRPYFKPSKRSERGLNSYSILETDKRIIFPYDEDGHLIEEKIMKTKYKGTFAYLQDNYARLLPSCVSKEGHRDVPGATEHTWYQYGRTQSLTAFINTPKLIVGILSRDPMYAYDDSDMLISSGGTAGYCAIKNKAGSPYCLEYVQAFLSSSYTERIIEIIGSDFEGGFISRGSFVLSSIPFAALDLTDGKQLAMYNSIVDDVHNIYSINNSLGGELSRAERETFENRKNFLIADIDKKIEHIYKMEF